jgi:hypothetical protein
MRKGSTGRWRKRKCMKTEENGGRCRKRGGGWEVEEDGGRWRKM